MWNKVSRSKRPISDPKFDDHWSELDGDASFCRGSMQTKLQADFQEVRTAQQNKSKSNPYKKHALIKLKGTDYVNPLV